MRTTSSTNGVVPVPIGSATTLCLAILASVALLSLFPDAGGPLNEDKAVRKYVLDPSFPQPSPIAFNEVTWMAFDQDAQVIYLLQRSGPPVSLWTPEGEFLAAWHTEALGDPHSIHLHRDASGSKWIWITDMAPPNPAGEAYGHCLKKFSPAGELVGTIGKCGKNTQGSGLDPVQFDKVTDVTWDRAGNLFVTDGDLDGLNNRVLKLSPDGTVLQDWSGPGGVPGSGPKEFNLPHAIQMDRCDRAWVADALNHRIQVITAKGDYQGEFACFAEEGVYGIAFGATSFSQDTPVSDLFVTTSPTDGGGRGKVWQFSVPMQCGAPAKFGSCDPVLSWEIDLPPTTSTAMLHAVTVSNATSAVYLSELGGNLPPQKWVPYRGGQ